MPIIGKPFDPQLFPKKFLFLRQQFHRILGNPLKGCKGFCTKEEVLTVIFSLRDFLPRLRFI